MSKDDRRTLAPEFAPLNALHHFTLDVAASKENAKCARYFDIEADGLSKSWMGETVWCNPPYSDLEPWVKKALLETREGGCPKVVMLLPANRTEQPFWQDWIEPIRDRGIGVTTQNLRKRRAFGTPDCPSGRNKKNGIPFGLVVVTFEARR